MRGISDATSRKGWRSQTEATVSTMDAPIQNPECPELIPVSPPGAYDGREKWAEVDVIPGSDAFSFTTPSWGDEAQAESHHEKILRGKTSSRLVLHGRQLERA